MSVTHRDAAFLHNIAIEEGRGDEPIYVGVYSDECPGEPHRIEDFDIDPETETLVLNIYQGGQKTKREKLELQAQVNEVMSVAMNIALKNILGEN